MTVFRGFFILMKRNLPAILLYFVIFVTIGVMIQTFMPKDQATEGFKKAKQNIAIVDNDKSELSKNLVAYVKDTQNLKTNYDVSTKEKIQDNLYYENIDCVIIIPKNWEKDFVSKHKNVDLLKSAAYKIAYATNAINSYLDDTYIYIKSGMSIEAASKASAKLDNMTSHIELLANNKHGGNLSPISFAFRFLPYLILALAIYGISIILAIFADTDRKKRILASPVSSTKKNLQLFLGILIFGVAIWIIAVFAMPVAFSGGFGLFKDTNMPYYMLNGTLLVVVSVAMAFMLGKIIKKVEVITMLANVITLGMSFLCGVFVEFSMLSAGVQSFSKFLPVYWYEKIVDILAYNNNFSHVQESFMTKGYAIQLLFAVAFVVIGLFVEKLRTRD